MNPSYLRWLRRALVGLAGLVLAFAFALACTFVYLAPSLPTAERLHDLDGEVPLRVYTRSGGLIQQIGEKRQIPIRYEDIPPLVRQAVLAAEDDRFFEHSGLDWMGIVRAMVMNVATMSDGQGGSTITQQAARNVFLTLDKTLRRKLSEVFLTYRMERDFSKEDILTIYLNNIYFGQRSYGVAAAAETFYGKKHLEDLTVAQAATLAGIIQVPSRYNPVTNPRAAENRRSYVLGRMTKLGFIDAETAATAAREPVAPAARGFAPLYDTEAPYLAELVRQELVRRFGANAVNEGFKVFTTIDDRLQTNANRALRLGLMEYDRGRGYRGHLGKIDLPSAPTEEDFAAGLEKYESVSLLTPAVVTGVGATSADVYVQDLGKARINWDGLSWARPVVRGGLGPNPTKAANVVKRGDVVYVVTDGRGNAQLAQLPRAQSALVALDPMDGAVVSMVGGFSFFNNNFNRATQAHRQPGSGFKPFLYSAALENGFTPASIVLDMPPVIDDSNSEENWRPENSNGRFSGPMRLREALVLSRNTVSVRILQSMGIDAAIEHAAKFGFDKDSLPRYFTLALGTQTATPLEMATGFAVFANGGFKVEPYWISRIEDGSGKVVFEAAPKIACLECEESAWAAPPPEPAPEAWPPSAPNTPDSVTDAAIGSAIDDAAVPPPPPAPPYRVKIHEVDAAPGLREMARVQGGLGYLPADRLAPRVISAQNAWLMTDILHDVTVRGTAVRSTALGRNDLAGKTGTSQNSRDAWFNGFNGNIVASVWVGFDDEQSLGAGQEGSNVALPIWMYYMREALRGTPEKRLERPAGLVDIRVSGRTGLIADPLDPDAIVETFMPSQLPRSPGPGDPGYSSGFPGTGPGGSGEPLF